MIVPRWFRLSFLGYLIVCALVSAASTGFFYGPALGFRVVEALSLGFLIGLFTEPFWFRLFMRAKPYEGESAERMRAFIAAHAKGFSVKSITVTQSKFSNASSIGIGIGGGIGGGINFTQKFLDGHPWDETEAVLAHEMGHIRNRDTSVWAIAAFALVMAAGIGEGIFLSQSAPGAWVPFLFWDIVGSGLLYLCVLLPLSRHRERLADSYALSIIENPTALARFFERWALLREEAGEMVPHNPSRFRMLLSSHPSTYERMKNAEARAGLFIQKP